MSTESSDDGAILLRRKSKKSSSKKRILGNGRAKNPHTKRTILGMSDDDDDDDDDTGRIERKRLVAVPKVVDEADGSGTESSDDADDHIVDDADDDDDADDSGRIDNALLESDSESGGADEEDDEEEDSGEMSVGDETSAELRAKEGGKGRKKRGDGAYVTSSMFDARYDDESGEFDFVGTPLSLVPGGVIFGVMVSICHANLINSTTFGDIEKMRTSKGEHTCGDDPLNLMRSEMTPHCFAQDDERAAGSLEAILSTDKTARETRSAAREIAIAESACKTSRATQNSGAALAYLIVMITCGGAFREAISDSNGMHRVRAKVSNIGLPGLDIHEAACNPVHHETAAKTMPLSHYEMRRYCVTAKSELMTSPSVCIGGLPLFANCAAVLDGRAIVPFILNEELGAKMRPVKTAFGRPVVEVVDRYVVRESPLITARIDLSSDAFARAEMCSAKRRDQSPEEPKHALLRMLKVDVPTDDVPKDEQFVADLFAQLRDDTWQSAYVKSVGQRTVTWVTPPDNLLRTRNMMRARIQAARHSFGTADTPRGNGTPKIKALSEFSAISHAIRAMFVRIEQVGPVQIASGLRGFSSREGLVSPQCVEYLMNPGQISTLWGVMRESDIATVSMMGSTLRAPIKVPRVTIPRMWMGADVSVSDMNLLPAMKSLMMNLLPADEVRMVKLGMASLSNREKQSIAQQTYSYGTPGRASEHMPIVARTRAAMTYSCFQSMTQAAMGIAKMLSFDTALLAIKYGEAEHLYSALVGQTPQRILLGYEYDGAAKNARRNWVHHACVAANRGDDSCTQTEAGVAKNFARIVYARFTGGSFLDAVMRVGPICEEATAMMDFLLRLNGIVNILRRRKTVSHANQELIVGTISECNSAFLRLVYPHSRAEVPLAEFKVTADKSAFSHIGNYVQAHHVASMLSNSEVGAFPDGVDVVRMDTFDAATKAFTGALAHCIDGRKKSAIILCSCARARAEMVKFIDTLGFDDEESSRISVRYVGGVLLSRAAKETETRSARGNASSPELFVPYAHEFNTGDLIEAMATLTTFAYDELVTRASDGGICREMLKAVCGIEHVMEVGGASNSVAEWRKEGLVHSRLFLGGMACRPRNLLHDERPGGVSLLDGVFFSLGSEQLVEMKQRNFAEAMFRDDHTDHIRAAFSVGGLEEWFQRVPVESKSVDVAACVSELPGADMLRCGDREAALILLDSDSAETFALRALRAAQANAAAELVEGRVARTLFLCNYWLMEEFPLPRLLVQSGRADLQDARDKLRDGHIVVAPANERVAVRKLCGGVTLVGDIEGRSNDQGEPVRTLVVDVDSNTVESALDVGGQSFCASRKAASGLPLDVLLGLTLPGVPKQTIARGTYDELISDKLGERAMQPAGTILTRLEREVTAKSSDHQTWFWTTRACGISMISYVLERKIKP